MLDVPEIVDSGRLYSRREVADVLDIDPRTVAKIISRGDLPAVKIGDREKVLGRALAEFMLGVAK